MVIMRPHAVPNDRARKELGQGHSARFVPRQNVARRVPWDIFNEPENVLKTNGRKLSSRGTEAEKLLKINGIFTCRKPQKQRDKVSESESDKMFAPRTGVKHDPLRAGWPCARLPQAQIQALSARRHVTQWNGGKILKTQATGCRYQTVRSSVSSRVSHPSWGRT